MIEISGRSVQSLPAWSRLAFSSHHIFSLCPVCETRLCFASLQNLPARARLIQRQLINSSRTNKARKEWVGICDRKTPIYIYIYTHIYIYIYIYRERERERYVCVYIYIYIHTYIYIYICLFIYLFLVPQNPVRSNPDKPRLAGAERRMYICIYIYIYIQPLNIAKIIQHILLSWLC